MYVSFSVLRRVGEYALSKPAREVLFTVVSREEKYKAKNFIDTAVSRGGDASTGWLVSGIKALGVTTTHIAWALVPFMLLWAWLSHWLAAQQRRQVRSPELLAPVPACKRTDPRPRGLSLTHKKIAWYSPARQMIGSVMC